jgi:hypothetical protein
MKLTTRGDEFIQHLIGDYESAASYWRLTANLLRHQIESYRYMPEELEAQREEIAWANATAKEMEANAIQLRGGNGEPLPDPISQLPERHTEQLQKITCTTVL